MFLNLVDNSYLNFAGTFIYISVYFVGLVTVILYD